MEYGLGDKVVMKKNHPCGGNLWQVTRVGADIKIKCGKCGCVVMMEREQFDKRLKKVLEKGNGDGG